MLRFSLWTPSPRKAYEPSNPLRHRGDKLEVSGHACVFPFVEHATGAACVDATTGLKFKLQLGCTLEAMFLVDCAKSYALRRPVAETPQPYPSLAASNFSQAFGTSSVRMHLKRRTGQLKVRDELHMRYNMQFHHFPRASKSPELGNI